MTRLALIGVILAILGNFMFHKGMKGCLFQNEKSQLRLTIGLFLMGIQLGITVSITFFYFQGL